MCYLTPPHSTPTIIGKGNKVAEPSSENIISTTKVIRNIYRAKTIKIEVYNFLFHWIPNGHTTHPPKS